MDGNLYPNAGDDMDTTYYPELPKERVEAEAKQKSIKAASYPVMADVEEWFRTQIAECDSIDNIQIDKVTIRGVLYERTISIEAQILAQRLLKDLLSSKYEDFKDWRREEDN